MTATNEKLSESELKKCERKFKYGDDIIKHWKKIT